MHTYFDEWSGKHPLPTDLQASFERTTGKKLDWFFDGMIKTNTKLDYAVTNISNEGLITVKNNTKIAAPFSITAIKNAQSAAR